MRMQRGNGSVIACALAACVLVGTAARADVAPGDKITEQNVDKVKDLISPGLEWCIRHGWPITIGETKRIEWPKVYREATEKYSGQVKLAADGLRLENYVAGMPFPNVDPKDPQIAIKIMQNFDYRPETGDDLDLRNFDADTGSIADHGPMTVERHFLLDHLRRLYWNARLYVDPKPEKPNPNGYRAQQGLYPILEPFDLKGVGALGNRYLDPAKQDDSWLYLPSLRRVRRLSTAQRSDALFGQDTDVDSYDGYAGQIAWMDWKYLGERDVIGVMHAEHFPVEWDPKVDWAFNDKWEKRHVYAIEGVSKLPQYAYSKRVIFIDKEAYAIPFTDIYDRSGELWKVWINEFSWRKSAFPGGGAIEYPDEMAFLPSIVMVDMQLEHATKAALPSHRFPGEQGWYFNQGEKAGVTDDWFTVAALVAAGH
ncbi:MAG TPA: DUF1329 domain-containing protein [Candidatus Binatia bacterium]|nr:DUF1329 domain-containing protein [Candidatus Binatia bacterium]